MLLNPFNANECKKLNRHQKLLPLRNTKTGDA